MRLYHQPSNGSILYTVVLLVVVVAVRLADPDEVNLDPDLTLGKKPDSDQDPTLAEKVGSGSEPYKIRIKLDGKKQVLLKENSKRDFGSGCLD